MPLSKMPPTTVAEVNEILLKHVQAMEREALPVDGDYPTGLWWYVGHLDRDGEARKVNNTEVAWSQRLTAMLVEAGWPSWTEFRYPGATRDRCDTVVDWGFAKPWWIELKGAWPIQFDTGATNKSFLKHLNATADDIEKLNTLSNTDASGVSLILVGFDLIDRPIFNANLAIVRTVIDSRWQEAHLAFDVQQRITFRTNIWVWSRLS